MVHMALVPASVVNCVLFAPPRADPSEEATAKLAQGRDCMHEAIISVVSRSCAEYPLYENSNISVHVLQYFYESRLLKDVLSLAWSNTRLKLPPIHRSIL